MARAEDFDMLLGAVPEETHTRVGLPWNRTPLVVRAGSRPGIDIGPQSITTTGSNLQGEVKVDGFNSIQKKIGPLVEHDAPTGIIPSTLFTPFPRDILGIDRDYIELIAIVGAVMAFSTFSNMSDLKNMVRFE
jgi:hypothetical protein